MKKILSIGLVASGMLVTGQAFAEKTSSAANEPSSAPIFFASQKFWAATWDIPLMDAAITLPGPNLTTNPKHFVSDTALIPVTAVGASYAGFTLVGNLYSETDFSISSQNGQKVSRKEYDISLGYAILPNLTASLAYKNGSISQGITQNTATLTGGSTSSSSYDVTGWLLGISGSVPLSGPLSLYGNVAYGTATEKLKNSSSVGKSSFDGNYKIGEIGLSYRIADSSNMSFLKSATIQLGYRAQVITIRDFPFHTFSLANPTTPISTERLNVKSTTDGFILGLVAAF